MKLFSLMRDERGGVLITTGLSILFLIGVAGASLDLGKQQLLRARTQQSSDAAALAAGGLADSGGNPQQVALRYFNLNFSTTYMGTPRPTPTIAVGTNSISITASNKMDATFMQGISSPKMNAGGRTVVAMENSAGVSQKYDVILVMDASGSMSAADVGNASFLNPSGNGTCIPYNPSSYGCAYALPGPSRMNALRYAANTLVTQLINPNDSDSRVGAITWSDAVVGQQNLSGDYNTVRKFLNEMVPYQGTNSTAGLKAAQNMAAGFRNDSVHAVILLTDGQNGSWSNGQIGSSVIPASSINPQSLSVCSSFKSSGTVVYTIALGTPVISDSVARNFLSNCASNKPGGGKFYYQAPDSATLNAVFQTIVEEIKRLRITS